MGEHNNQDHHLRPMEDNTNRGHIEKKRSKAMQVIVVGISQDNNTNKKDHNSKIMAVSAGTTQDNKIDHKLMVEIAAINQGNKRDLKLVEGSINKGLTGRKKRKAMLEVMGITQHNNSKDLYTLLEINQEHKEKKRRKAQLINFLNLNKVKWCRFILTSSR